MNPSRVLHFLVADLSLLLLLTCTGTLAAGAVSVPDNSSRMQAKAAWFQQDLLDKHWLDGLYVSIVPSAPSGARLEHSVDEPGNVIHAGVWTGRYLGGVGYQYAVTKDPWVRRHGGQMLAALRLLQEVTGKPGLLARGYVRGHGPVTDWERGGADSKEWHQGQGAYADYRWYGDVSVDNFNAVLYGYAIYYDLAADAGQKEFITRDVERLMTHLLDNHCRIIDVDGEVTQWGHVGIDPEPTRDGYYQKVYGAYLQRAGLTNGPWQPSLRGSLMLLPDLLIADHITGNPRYRDLYRRAVARCRDNPDLRPEGGPFSLERLARVNHSSEGQAYEALYNLVRYEKDSTLLAKYRGWLTDLWEMNWMEGNSLFAFMTLALLPEHRAPLKPGVGRGVPSAIPHGEEALRLARDTLRDFPVDRVLRPVMNSLRADVERNPSVDRQGQPQSARPIPIERRPLDNEYAWKGNPYQMDGWLKPAIRMFQFSADDPEVAWFCDSAGRLFLTQDGGRAWRDVSAGLMGASVENIRASTNRTFVVLARTDRGVMLSRDGGLSWRTAPESIQADFSTPKFQEWLPISKSLSLRISEAGALVKTTDGGRTAAPCMEGWRIPRANSVFITPWGVVAGGPGGCYRSADAERWTEIRLWREDETGAADFLHAYWIGRYYGFVGKKD
jgi:hypothetical protein